MLTNNKIRALVASTALVVGAISANATPLVPGAGIPSVSEVAPVSATTLFSTNVSWGASFSFSGTLTSSVLTGDLSNPLGGLTFTYQFSIDSGSSHSASGISIGNFSTFLTDVSYVAGTGKKPLVFGRSDESLTEGDTIQFSFIGSLVSAGTNSALLVVQTDATVWTQSIASVINSSAFPDIPTLAPLDVVPVEVVPEPTVMGLAALGVATLACLKRRKLSTGSNSGK